MACDEMQKRHFNDRINHIILTPIKKTLKCDVYVSVNIKNNNNLLSDWSYGVDLTMCRQKKRASILKYQSNIASKPAPGMQSYIMAKNKHLPSRLGR